MEKASNNIIADFLINVGEALKSENPSSDELNVVFDSIKESPEQFQELYNDFINNTFIGKLAAADNLLRKMIAESNIDRGKFKVIQEFKNSPQ